MGQRVAGETVCPALEDDELRLRLIEIGLDLPPRITEIRIVGARRQRQIELGADRGPVPGLVAGAGTREQESPVLMDIGKQYVRVFSESVVHAVTMMGIDIHIGDTAQAMTPAQRLDQHRAVVEHTETGSPVAGGMMQPGDRHKGPARGARHHHLCGAQRGADYRPGGLIDAGKGRGVTKVQIALADQRHLLDKTDMMRRMEPLHLLARRGPRIVEQHPGFELALSQTAEKGVMTIGSERMTVAKAIARGRLAADDGHPIVGRAAHEDIEISTGPGRKETRRAARGGW